MHNVCVSIYVYVYYLHPILFVSSAHQRLEEFQLPDEGLGVAAFAVDPLHELVEFDQIAGIRAAVQLVLEIVLDVPHE